MSTVLSSALVDFLVPSEHRRLILLSKEWCGEITSRVPVYHVDMVKFRSMLRQVSDYVSEKVYWTCVRQVVGPRLVELAPFPARFYRCGAPCISVADQSLQILVQWTKRVQSLVSDDTGTSLLVPALNDPAQQ